MFSADQLSKIVNETLPAEAAGKRNAVVGAIDQHGTRVIARFKLDEQGRWQVRGIWDHEWTGEDTKQAQVLFSWGDK
jgi:hypothetical protein